MTQQKDTILSCCSDPLWLGAGSPTHHLHGGPLDSVMQAKIISLGPLCKNRGFRTCGDPLQDPRAGSLVVGLGSSCSVFWEVEAQGGGPRDGSTSFPRERQSSAGDPGQGGSGSWTQWHPGELGFFLSFCLTTPQVLASSPRGVKVAATHPGTAGLYCK